MASCPVFAPAIGATIVNVSTLAQLTAAIANANPGDDIVMAPGTYNLTGTVTVNTRGATQANPIRLRGPRTAILNGSGLANYTYLNPRCQWWYFQGFKIQNCINGLETGTYGNATIGASDNVFCDIEIGSTGQGSIVLRGTSSRNLFQENWIHDSGVNEFYYGEGFYIGSGVTSDHPANDNHLLNNVIGPNIRADHVDVKAGTSGNLIEGTVSDCTGFRWTNGSDSGGQVTDSVQSNQGLNTHYNNNTINNLSAAVSQQFVGEGFFNWQGSGTRWHGNTVNGGPANHGFATSGGTDNPVHCDNTVTGGIAFANVTCTAVSGGTVWKTVGTRMQITTTGGGTGWKTAGTRMQIDVPGGGPGWAIRRLYGGVKQAAQGRRYW